MNDKIKAFEEEYVMFSACTDDCYNVAVVAFISKDLESLLRDANEKHGVTWEDIVGNSLCDALVADDVTSIDNALISIANKFVELTHYDASDTFNDLVVIKADAEDDDSHVAAFDMASPINRSVKLAFPAPEDLLEYIENLINTTTFKVDVTKFLAEGDII